MHTDPNRAPARDFVDRFLVDLAEVAIRKWSLVALKVTVNLPPLRSLPEGYRMVHKTNRHRSGPPWMTGGESDRERGASALRFTTVSTHNRLWR